MSALKGLLRLFPTIGEDLEPGESVIMEAFGQFDRVTFKGMPVVASEGKLVLTDRRLLYAPFDFAKIFSPFSLLGHPGAVSIAIAKVVQYREKAKSLPLITDVWPSGDGSITGLPKLSVTLATGDKYQFGIGSGDLRLGFVKANIKVRDAFVEAIRRQIDCDSSS